MSDRSTLLSSLCLCAHHGHGVNSNEEYQYELLVNVNSVLWFPFMYLKHCYDNVKSIPLVLMEFEQSYITPDFFRHTSLNT